MLISKISSSFRILVYQCLEPNKWPKVLCREVKYNFFHGPIVKKTNRPEGPGRFFEMDAVSHCIRVILLSVSGVDGNSKSFLAVLLPAEQKFLFQIKSAAVEQQR